MTGRDEMGGRQPSGDPGRTRRRAGRPRTGERHLTRRGILDAAQRIVDRDGVDALSMRRLASDLGVNPMSLYHHLPSKAAVLSGLVDELFSRMHVPEPQGADWREALKDAVRAYRGAVRRHPNLALQIVSQPGPVSDVMVASAEPLYAALEGAGLPARTIMDGVNTLVDFVHGFMLGEATSPSPTFDLGPDLLQRLRALPPAAAPALTRVAEELGEDGLRYDFDTGFEVGLDLIVRGIEAAAPAPRTRRTGAGPHDA